MKQHHPLNSTIHLTGWFGFHLSYPAIIKAFYIATKWQADDSLVAHLRTSRPSYVHMVMQSSHFTPNVCHRC